MKQKRLGVDIDGVITEEELGFNKNIWHHYLCDYLGREVKKRDDIYNIYKAYNLSKDTIDNFLIENLNDIYNDLIPANNCSEILSELEEQGFDIIIITAREEKYKSITEQWLKKYNINYSKLIHEKEKVPIAKEEGIKLFIEDDKDNAEKMYQNGIDVILFDKLHNKNTTLIKEDWRVENWVQAREIIYSYFKLTSLIFKNR